MSNTVIRKLENKDINKIMSIWLESTIKAHEFIDKSYWENSYIIVRDVYIPMAETYVYEDNDEIKGFISIINKEFIGALFIDNHYQGKGAGTKLLEFVKNIYGKLTLAVYKDNIRSVEFYKKLGFKIIGEGPNEETKVFEFHMVN
ncbi:MAG: N-acetyltransferase [Cetobacterium sp.]|uniref:N-acetyltransferase n=1 Tax=Cetobacterium sp. TaxID=2071632 RepID=UPI002FCA84AF